MAVTKNKGGPMQPDMAKVACEELFIVQNELLYLKPARNEFPYEQEAREGNPKVNKVWIV